jgi:hypothetical protein
MRIGKPVHVRLSKDLDPSEPLLHAKRIDGINNRIKVYQHCHPIWGGVTLHSKMYRVIKRAKK